MRLVALCLLLVGGAAWSAEEIHLPVTSDNSICCHESETKNNMGKSSRIKMKGIENLLLFNFDAKPLAGKKVSKAVLRIKACDKNVMVRKVGFSTVATPWNEGSVAGDKQAENGDSCFQGPEFGSDKTWAGPKSNFLDVIWGRGGTLWTQSYVKNDEQMWFEMEFDGRLLEACAAGLSYGLCVSDDNGQTKNTHKDVIGDGNMSNNFFFSREQNNAQPEFIVTAEPVPVTDPPAVQPAEVKPWPHGANFESGGLELSWPGPKDEAAFKDTLGYRVKLALDGGEMKELPRWMLPAVAQLGERARALLMALPAGAKAKARVEVVGRGGNLMGSFEGSGEVSAKFPLPPKLEIAKLERAAGDPPGNAAGRVWALPDGTKANPITGNVLEEPGVGYEADAAGKYSQANAVWSGKDRSITLTALRGEWAAFQIVCQNAGNAAVNYSVTPGDLKGPNGAVIPAAAIQLSRLWYQKLDKTGERGWYADPMLPLKAGDIFAVPDPKNKVPAQANQSVYVEFFVPKDAAAGMYEGSLAVKAGDGDALPVAIKLEVFGAKIPEEAHFVWSMNAYSSPGWGAAGSDDFIATERSFYVLSHLHRAPLAVLHYSHGGKYQDGAALPLAGQGKEMKVGDWSAWDKRFGPLLDGSAFKGTPREGTAIDHFYLTLAEHYPTKMAEGYKWNESSWEDHWKVAGPIEEGFSPQYQEQWVAVAADFMKHFQEKGYKTHFQIYLNDKYYYKQYVNDGKKKGPGNGVSFWLLDEPQHIDDFVALAFFGKLFRKAQTLVGGEAAKTILYRADVSRPQWGRDTLDRILDLNVSGGFSGYRPWLEDWRERYGQRVWTYGGAPSSKSSALGIVAQGLDLYSRGVDGFVPWLTLGGEKNWERFEDTCVFYTGKPHNIQGACASLRLKAYRRAEQDIEYVRLFAEKNGLLKDDPDRVQVAKLLGGAIQSTKKLGTLDAQGAVTESFDGLKAEDFEQLRRALGKALQEK
ncbi:MAG: hypothetical protein HY291_04120 [Planctomycetes bacterium]|nr:hypothetical protein [Planctomycetota bacterium]